MNYLSSVKSYFHSTIFFINDKILKNTTPLQKKITLAALTAFACLGAGYLFYCRLKSKTAVAVVLQDEKGKTFLPLQSVKKEDKEEQVGEEKQVGEEEEIELEQKNLIKNGSELPIDSKVSVEQKPKERSALFHDGHTLLGQGKHDAAIIDFEEILKLDPDDIEALNYYGECLKLQGKYEEAVIQFKKVLSLNPNNAFALGSYGSVLILQEKYEEAICKFEEALKLDPNDVFNISCYGEALRLQGKCEEAIIQHEKVYTKIKSSEVKFNIECYLYYYANALFQQGQREALKKVKECLAIDPDYTWALKLQSKLEVV